MGMFDEIICKMPLPISGKVDARFQSKDTPDQYMSVYEIREDGAMWKVRDSDVDDFAECKVDCTGCIEFYADEIEAKACYLNGKLQWIGELDDKTGKWVTK